MVGRLMMDCTKIEQMLPAYTLGSLAESETAVFTAHIDGCASCAVKVREAGDTLVNLARMVPQKHPSKRVKDGIFARIDQEGQQETQPPQPWLDFVRSLGRQLALSPGTSLAVVFLVAAVIVGYWTSRNLHDLQDLRGDIEQRMESVAQQQKDLREGIEQQHRLIETIATDPNVTVKRLSANLPTVPLPGHESPSGVIVISAKESTVTIAAMHLPQLPRNQAYHVWLIKHGGQEVRTATLTVDSTGAGHAEVAIDVPLEEFRAILITIDDVNAGPGSVGNSALRGDL
ncbi:MAG: anti-sigma factor [Dehalococcoidia bacterium]|nr:anti-sigma factor [Dehalococcoidia bacterium]